MNSKIAFIVEGHMEQKLVQLFCNGASVRRLQCNSKTAPPATIAKRLAPTLPFLKRAWKIFVVFDREKRNLSANELAEQVIQELRNENVDVSQLEVIVADRSTENWILADIEGIKRVPYVRQDAKQQDFEGKMGKGELRKILADDAG